MKYTITLNSIGVTYINSILVYRCWLIKDPGYLHRLDINYRSTLRAIYFHEQSCIK